MKSTKRQRQAACAAAGHPNCQMCPGKAEYERYPGFWVCGICAEEC